MRGGMPDALQLSHLRAVIERLALLRLLIFFGHKFFRQD
jgi:hypothetical protein